MAVTHVPTNFFVKDVFNNNLPENHEYEQFFWTTNVVDKLMKSFEYDFVDETCCLTTPSLAVGMHNKGRDEVLLDIDSRFGFLPKYKYYDVRAPYGLDTKFKLLVLDPPFFVVPIEEFRKAVDILTKHDYSTKLIIGFIKREEKLLMEAFKEYKLKPTNFELEYSSIKPNKWRNFCLYSNVDMPGIKQRGETPHYNFLGKGLSEAS